MTAIGLCSAALIVTVVSFTRPFIAANQSAALGSAVFSVLPGAESKRTIRLATDSPDSAAGAKAHSTLPARQIVYAGYSRDGELVGVAIEARGPGFQDTIRLLYGYAPDRRRVIGIFVLESRETPGLGDRIEFDPDFLRNFSDLSIDNIQFVKAGRSSRAKRNPAQNAGDDAIYAGEIEGISGATISSRAVARIVSTSIETMAPLIADQPSGAFASTEPSRKTPLTGTNAKTKTTGGSEDR